MLGEEIRPIRVVVGDDRAMFRQGLRAELEQAARLAVVGAAGDGDEVLRLIARHQPDVLTLGETPRDLAGIDVAREVRRRFPEVAILMITAIGGSGYLRTLRELGVSGHLPCTAGGEEITAAIHAIVRGHPVFVGGMGRDPSVASAVQLTDREREVLGLLVDGFRNADVARRLSISEKTVDFHVGHLFAKLGARSRIEAVMSAQRLGLADASEAGRSPPREAASRRPRIGVSMPRGEPGDLGSFPGIRPGDLPMYEPGLHPVVPDDRAE